MSRPKCFVIEIELSEFHHNKQSADSTSEFSEPPQKPNGVGDSSNTSAVSVSFSSSGGFVSSDTHNRGEVTDHESEEIKDKLAATV